MDPLSCPSKLPIRSAFKTVSLSFPDSDDDQSGLMASGIDDSHTTQRGLEGGQDIMNTSSATGGFSSVMETSIDSRFGGGIEPLARNGKDDEMDVSSSSMRDTSRLTAGARSRPQSEAIDRLDESVRFMMQLNGNFPDGGDIRSKSSASNVIHTKEKNSNGQGTVLSRQRNSDEKSLSLADVSNGQVVTRSFEQETLQHSVTKKEIQTTAHTFRSSTARTHQEMVISKGDVVRIKVPYGPEGASDTKADKNRP